MTKEPNIHFYVEVEDGGRIRLLKVPDVVIVQVSEHERNGPNEFRLRDLLIDPHVTVRRTRQNSESGELLADKQIYRLIDEAKREDADLVEVDLIMN